MAIERDRYEHEHQRLEELTHQNRMNFIDAELKLGLTLAQMAETEYDRGDKPHAKALLEKAEHAMDSVRKYMADGQLSDAERRDVHERARAVINRHRAAKQRILGAQRRGQVKGAQA